MKTYYVKDLEKGLVLNNETFAVKMAETGLTKDNKTYYKLLLIDKTGEVKAQIWNDKIPNVEKAALTPGNIIMVNGTVEDYRGVLQINIFGAGKVDESIIADYMEASDFDIEELWKDLNKHINAVKSTEIKALLTKLFSDPEMVRKFKTYPAAEYVHHAFQGGLLEHVVEMLDCAQPLRRYYPECNFDLVTAGIIFHDIGKLWELEPVGVTTQRTTEGYLVGHLIKSFEVMSGFAEGVLSAATLLSLKHIILSHHGLLEFGSPIIPATIEANIVTYIDQLSSKTRIFQKVLRRNSDTVGQFTEWDKLLGTKVYLGDYQQED